MNSPVLLWGKVFPSFHWLAICLIFPFPHLSTLPPQYFHSCFPPPFSPSQISSPSLFLPQHPFSLPSPSQMNDSVYVKFIMCWKSQILLVLHLSSLFLGHPTPTLLLMFYTNTLQTAQDGDRGRFNFPPPQRLHTHTEVVVGQGQ